MPLTRGAPPGASAAAVCPAATRRCIDRTGSDFYYPVTVGLQERG